MARAGQEGTGFDPQHAPHPNVLTQRRKWAPNHVQKITMQWCARRGALLAHVSKARRDICRTPPAPPRSGFATAAAQAGGWRCRPSPPLSIVAQKVGVPCGCQHLVRPIRLQIRNCVLRYKRVSYDAPGVHRTRKNALRRKCDEIEYLMCQDTRFVTRHESVSWDDACLRESI